METQEVYIAPHVEIGDLVLWYADPQRENNTNETTHIAIVTRLGNDSICLNVLSPSSYNFSIKDGVRHVSDPRARQSELRENGAWEHTPKTKRLEALTVKINMIFARLAREGNPELVEILAKEKREAQAAEMLKKNLEEKAKKGQ